MVTHSMHPLSSRSPMWHPSDITLGHADNLEKSYWLKGHRGNLRVQNDGWKFVSTQGMILELLDAPHGLELSSPAINRGSVTQ
nr:hypothetical protein [Tanacetum cinerariifolium]